MTSSASQSECPDPPGTCRKRLWRWLRWAALAVTACLFLLIVCTGDRPIKQQPTVPMLVGRWEDDVSDLLPTSKGPTGQRTAILDLYPDSTFQIHNYPVRPRMAISSWPLEPKTGSGTWVIEYNESIDEGWHVGLFFTEERTWWAGFLIVDDRAGLGLVNYVVEYERLCLRKVGPSPSVNTTQPSASATDGHDDGE